MAPDCKRTQEGWGSPSTHQHGPPPLPPSGSSTEGPLAGWYIQYRARYEYAAIGDFSNGFVAYCPLHAAPAIAWVGAYRAWESERYQVGRTEALSWLERLAEWLAPKSERDARVARETHKAVSAWKVGHPPPKPPWRT
jgi:hypothetical protein